MSLPLTSTCVGGRRAMEINCSPAFVSAVIASAIELPPPMFGLTVKQRELVDTVIRVGSCVVAANVLRKSIKTVECQMARIREVIGVDTNYQLIAAYVTAQLKENQ